MKTEKLKTALKSFGRELVLFFNPRDWLPSIPLPPVGPWEPKGDGVQTLGEAIRGFKKD